MQQSRRTGAYRGPVATSSSSTGVAFGWRRAFDDQIATTPNDRPEGAPQPQDSETSVTTDNLAFQTEQATDSHVPIQERSDQTSAQQRGPRGGLTSRGAFVMILTVTSAACVAGFLMTSAAVIPAIAGWGLALSAIAAATLIREPDKLMAVWLPPLVMALVIGVLGQVTLLGSSPTLARELSMFLAAMASAAPAQVVAVLGTFIIVRWRFPKGRKHTKTDAPDAETGAPDTKADTPKEQTD